MQQNWLFQHKALLLAMILMSALLSASIVAQAYSIVHIIDIVFLQTLDFSHTLRYFNILALAMLVRLLANFVLERLGSRLSARIQQQVRQQLLATWQQRSLLTQLQKKTGEEVSLFIHTVDELDAYFHEYIPQVIKSTMIPLVALICVFLAHPNSGWIMLITAPFIPLTYIIVGLQTQQKAQGQLEAMNRFSGTFLDLLHGVQTIRIFRQQQEKQQQLKDSNSQFLTQTMAILKIAFASTLFIELITTLGIGLVALEIGFQMIVFHSLTFVPAFFVLILAPEYYNTLKQLGGAFHTAKGSQGAMALIHEVLHEQTQTVQWGTEHMPNKPSLSLQQACIAYNEQTTIGPITLHIEAGQTVALIGATGHGKSTLLNMLASTFELTAGDIYIQQQLRSTVASQAYYDDMVFISQRSHVFTGTLRDNITMGKHVGDDTIIAAMKQAELIDWFETLPLGLETPIGEGGRGLSGGEKQRITIARAFVKQPSLLFFDEPTASLDLETERLVTRAIERLSEHATSVIVAHRFESIRHADYIYVVEHGKITASGTHKTLQHPLYIAMKGAH